MMIVLCTAVYILFALSDIIPIVKGKRWKALVVYSIFITMAYILTLLTELGVKIYSPTYPIKHIITAILGG